MDNNYNNKDNNNQMNNDEELEETWENIRLPEYMVDNSINFIAKKY